MTAWSLTTEQLRAGLGLGEPPNALHGSYGDGVAFIHGVCDHVPDRSNAWGDRTCRCGRVAISLHAMRTCATADEFVQLVKSKRTPPPKWSPPQWKATKKGLGHEAPRPSVSPLARPCALSSHDVSALLSGGRTRLIDLDEFDA